MRLGKRWRLSLQTEIIVLVCSVVAVCLLLTSFLISRETQFNIQQEIGQRALNIARMVAANPTVIDGLSGHAPAASIQPYAEAMMNITQVEFIVVFDMNGVRKSHRNPEKIGYRVVGGDEGPVLAGQETISTAQGTLGYSLRGFAPVYDENGQQVGAVLVGILMTQVAAAQQYTRLIIFSISLFGIAAGVFGALYLARRVKRTLLGLEPDEIAKQLEERSVMLQSVREGIIAVDRAGHITLINDVACRMLKNSKLPDELLGKSVNQVIPTTRLTEVLYSGQAEFDQEQELLGISVLTSRVPLLVNGQIVGAIATFRDKTEVKRLAEELTGVRVYVEALRSQAHEFMNRLHVILGLVRLECYEQLAAYINQIASDHQTEVNYVSQRVRDPMLAGFILSKLSLARENNIQMQLTEDSLLPEAADETVGHELVTIIGNLVENAFDAVRRTGWQQVTLSACYAEQQLVLCVSDTGPGLCMYNEEEIFLRGISTKDKNRGIGLALVKASVAQLRGTITVASNVQEGCCFTVTIPYEKKVIT